MSGARTSKQKQDSVFFSPSRSPQAVLKKQFAFLKKGIIDPSLHYHSLAQSKAWSKVFKAHCPVLRDRSFTRIYQELFKELPLSSQKPVHLIGLGCGTGEKEEWLARALHQRGLAIEKFTAVDVSEDLCRQSMKRLKPWLSQNMDAWVMDLDAARSLRVTLDRTAPRMNRIYTFFGLVPNLDPGIVVRIWKTLLRSGDSLLVSANLAPVLKKEESDIDEAIQKILPQYDNRETRQWLETLFLEQKISRKVLSSFRFQIKNQKDLSSIEVTASVLKDFNWKHGGQVMKFKKGSSLNIFQSRRWTPLKFEKWICDHGFQKKFSKITSNREEGVWMVRLPI